MRNGGDSARFNPQIAALAMPNESAYTKAAEGISNIGKVFLDSDEREQQNKLRGLQMQNAQEELKSKQFSNSIAGEEWDNKKTTYAQDIRNKKLEGLKKEIEWKADVKKQTDNGFMEQFKKLVPYQTFIDPQSGNFSEDRYQNARNEFKSAGGWASDNIHLFDGLADTYRKDSLESGKTKSEIAAKEAVAKKTNLEATTVIPEAEAKIAQQRSSAAKNYAGAALDNANVSLASRRVSAYEKQVAAQTGANGTKESNLKKDRQKIVADGKIETMVPRWGEFDDESQRYAINMYVEKGILPSATTQKVVKRGVFGDTVKTIPVYPRGTMGDDVPKTSIKPQNQPTKSVTEFEQTIVNPKTGDKMVLKNGAWVPIK